MAGTSVRTLLALSTKSRVDNFIAIFSCTKIQKYARL